jgi:Flp pilus assembly protein TadB
MPSTALIRLSCSALAITSTLQCCMLHRSRRQRQRSRTQQPGAAAQDLQLVRQERDALQRERDLLMPQVTMLHTMHQTTQ